MGTGTRLVLVAIVVGLVLSACSLGRGDAGATPPALEAYQPAAGEPVATEVAVDSQQLTSAGEDTNQNPAPPLLPSGPVLGRYTAEVLPVDQVPVIPEVSGQVMQLNMEIGDYVTKDDVLVSIDSSAYEAQRAQALAGLLAAQAQLDLLREGAEDRDIEAARAAVTAADEAYKRALEGPTQDDLTMAEAQLRQAQAAVKMAQAAYDQVSWNPLIAALPESLQLEQATLSLEAAQAQYDKISKGTTEDVIAGAYAQLAGARAQLQALEEGAKPAQIEAAQAQVNQAETALYLAQLQLDKTEVRAPIDGVVASLSTSLGSMAGQGTPVAVLLSPDVKIIVSVEESRLQDLYVGQPATIRVDAYPGREFAGEVSLIAPVLDAATRTVPVTIRPREDAGVLRPGMFATVELNQ